MFWVFSGGLSVTSGNDYIFVVEYNDNAAAGGDIAWLIHSPPAAKGRGYYHDASAVWSQVLGAEHIHEIWYTSSPEISSPPPGDGAGEGGFLRSFPVRARREFPIAAIREFPRQ